jgi:hypothetical protein
MANEVGMDVVTAAGKEERELGRDVELDGSLRSGTLELSAHLHPPRPKHLANTCDSRRSSRVK